MVGDKARGSTLMRAQVINLRLVTKHDVAGSEAGGMGTLHHLLKTGDQYILLNLTMDREE